MLSGSGSGSALQPSRRWGAELVGLGLDLVEEVLVGQAVALEVGLDALDRVLELPALDVVGEPVAGRVVGRGVRAHPVGVGLDERRALAVAGALQRGLVTAYVASTSLPSTRTPGKPKPSARW
jgi:hypothetical protein